MQAINTALKQVQSEWENNKFIINHEDEDVHSANERRLSELIGDIAKKLHIGRSRNDQTVTDTKLWLRKSIDKLLFRLKKFIEVLIARAEEDIDIVMPGYTHMQRAQPIRWSQWLLSYAWYAKQDLERLLQVRKHVNILPLGSGAIAGNPFAIDRQFLAMELGFEEITENSMHTVGDRDFVAEFLFWSSLSSIHLSRFCEDLIIYSTQEFNFVQFADKYSTGSSLMPQKRNPDCMELIRGKTGTIFGKCIGFMVTLKGIPSTYNKDLQEDKESLFYTYDTLYQMFHIAEKALATLKVNKKSCKRALTSDMLATDMAYYLVKKGVHFSEDMWQQRHNGKRKLKSRAIPTIFRFFLKGTNENEVSQTLKEHDIHAKEGQEINNILELNIEEYNTLNNIGECVIVNNIPKCDKGSDIDTVDTNTVGNNTAEYIIVSTECISNISEAKKRKKNEKNEEIIKKQKLHMVRMRKKR
ncbi:argininosuccinate lyase isoform X3 [Anoplolepis gracilipes]